MDGTQPMGRWRDVCDVSDIPARGARRYVLDGVEIGIFKTATGDVFAIDNACPHKGGPLSEGIVHDTGVTCPLHSLIIDLATGLARGADEGCVRTYAVEIKDNRVRLGPAD